MPAPPTSLRPSERPAFLHWLKRVKEHRGVSTRSVARALGRVDASNRQVNDYFGGRVFPMPNVLIRIARALDLPPLHVLSLGGYNSELMRPIENLFLLGQQWLEEDGYTVNRDLWVSTISDTINGCRYAPLHIDSQVLRLQPPNPHAEADLPYSIPMLCSIWTAVNFFCIREDVQRQPFSDDMKWSFVSTELLDAASKVKRRRTTGSAQLDRARELLLDARLSRQSAFFAACELVREWAAQNAPLLTAFAEVIHYANDRYIIDATNCDAEKLDFRLRPDIDFVCRQHEHPEYYESLMLGIEPGEKSDQ